MEADDEIKGGGNSYDFGNRMFDPRVGRWFSLDKHDHRYPARSSYSYALNNPIILMDKNGDDPITAIFEALGSMAFSIAEQMVSGLLENDGFSNFTMEKLEEAWDETSLFTAFKAGASTYAASVLVSGAGTIKRVSDFSKSKVGKFTMEFAKQLAEEAFVAYSEGKFDDEDGNFDIFALWDDEIWLDIAEKAVTNTLVALGFKKGNDKLDKEFNSSKSDISKQKSKLTENNESLNSGKGATKQTVENRKDKLNSAVKKTVGTGAKRTVRQVSESAASKGGQVGTQKAKTELRFKTRNFNFPRTGPAYKF